MLNAMPGQLHLFSFMEPSDSFRWRMPNGFTVSIRLEERAGQRYWYARKFANGKSYQEYICKQGELTEPALYDAARKIETAVSSAMTGGPS